MSEEKLSELMALAREHEPFETEKAGFGLETRVLARVREARANGEAAFLDELGKWVWRSAFGVAPAVAALLLWLCVWSGLSVESFVYDAVGDLVTYLPLD